MYEQTVNIEKSNNHLLTYVKGQMEPTLRQIDGTSCELEDEYRSYYTLACSDTYRFQLNRAINSVASEVLSLGYKNVYVRELLDVDYDNFYQNVLVNTICIFDSEYDKQFIGRAITQSPTLCLDGYYNFRMSQVKRKWQDISKLVSDNDFILADNELILEFLQYLLESIPCKERTLSVNIEKDTFTMFDKDNKVLSSVHSLAKHANVEEEAMLNIICMHPSKLSVYYNDKPCKDFCTMCETLFNPQFIAVQ